MARIHKGRDKSESPNLLAEHSYAPYLRKYAAMAAAKGKPRYLEWGPGTSSSIALEFFSETNAYLIEHDPEWMDYHNRHILTLHPKVHFFLLSKFSRQFRWHTCCEYTDLPVTWGLRFDLIMVDGKNREHCLETAALTVKPGGVVILHDSFRDSYHPVVTRLFEVVDGGLHPGDDPEDPDMTKGTAVLRAKPRKGPSPGCFLGKLSASPR